MKKALEFLCWWLVLAGITCALGALYEGNINPAAWSELTRTVVVLANVIWLVGMIIGQAEAEERRKKGQ